MTKLEAPQIPAPHDIDRPLSKRYTYQIVSKPQNAKEWPRTRVEILEDGETIYTYDRNYGMLKTFHPFRQFKDGEWRNYALISPDYGTYEVFDLQTKEIIATRGYPQRSWYRSEKYDEYANHKEKHPEWFEEGGYYEGKGPNDPINGEGFCPVEFYVPDWATNEGLSSKAEWDEAASYDWVDISTGMVGFVAGCIWGDDSSWKIRHIDLSRITEGIIEEDERYGYIELPYSLSLSQAICPAGGGRVQIATGLTYEADGKLSWWQKDQLPEFQEEKKK